MYKIINPCKVKIGKTFAQVFCKIEIKNGCLSISGVVGPNKWGNCRGGAGQIDMEFFHANLEHNDKRYSDLYSPHKHNMELTEGWTFATWFNFLAIWHDWHLNNMRSGCEHQRAMGWTYEDHHGIWEEREVKDKYVIDEYATGETEIECTYNEFKGHACPTCGYNIGSSWLKEELPLHVVYFLKNLPESKIAPAWV